MYQGLSGHSIAYNEHGIAPRASALGKRPGADDERARNARAAKKERRQRRAAPPRGPAAQPRKQRRERYVLRALRRDVRKAMRAGDTARFQALATRFEILMSARARRLEIMRDGAR